MEESRPPSYDKLTIFDLSAGLSEIMTTVFNVSSSGSFPESDSASSSSFEVLYDPSPEKYSQDLENNMLYRKAAKRTAHYAPRYAHTAPAVVQESSRLPLNTEKRPPPKFPPKPNATAPLRNAIYLFESSNAGTNSMSLAPLVDADEGQDRYSVHVSMNCFMPSSFITKIFHLNNLVGEFEMGIINTDISSKVKIWGLQFNIKDILSRWKGRDSGAWFWNPLGLNKKYCLKWDYSIRPCTCYSTVGGMNVLAKFTSPYGLNETSNAPILEVTPAGRETKLFEHILISLLIIERKRLTPDRDNNLKHLFN